jgi:Zn-dependent peptidase ImmA (M78 family)/DNA-binding XRE family transcriptional regulator
MFETHGIGERVRRLRLASGFSQIELARKAQVASGSISMLENGVLPAVGDVIDSIAAALGCTVEYLRTPLAPAVITRPWLRAYADAPQRAVDRQLADCALVAELIERARLPQIPDVLPRFYGDLASDSEIEEFALDVRSAAQIDEASVVGNVIRAAERLGCLVLPMPQELGRHLGISVRSDLTPVISVSQAAAGVPGVTPGDRQRFTVAHELGHLGLHANVGPPRTADDAVLFEKQANLFAGAFLAPGDAMLEELANNGGRVTLQTLTAIKAKWGIAIKALVTRFRQLGVIDAEHARSLYKQISARGWNKQEPVPVGGEHAIWLSRALDKRFGGGGIDAVSAASRYLGLNESYLRRWLNWDPAAPDDPDNVVALASRRGRSPRKRPADRGTQKL